MTKSVKIIGSIVLAMFIISVIIVIISFRTSDNKTVCIIQDNKVIYTLDLSEEEDRTFRIESSNGGWNDVRIENGKICIYDADCPDQTCVHTGFLRAEGVPIVCLPHRLIIRFADEENK